MGDRRCLSFHQQLRWFHQLHDSDHALVNIISVKVGRSIPFGVLAGATIPAHRRGPAADLLFRFGWPIFYDSIIGEVRSDFWRITFDARIYTYLLE